MILIDAIYIHIGGPKILLDYLMNELEKTDKKVTYLLDERVLGSIQKIKPENKITYQKAKLNNRKAFYKKHKNSFTTVLCLNNLPPGISLKATVYTYFHNSPFLHTIKEFSIKKNLLFSLKRTVLNYYKNNTNFWIAQTDFIKKKLQQKYSIKTESVLVLPFYEPANPDMLKVEKVKNQYVYVSLGLPYKNHLRLLEAFCRFYDKHKKGKLIVTLPEEFKEIIQLIQQKRKEGYPIENVGYLNREQVQQIFLQSEYHIFPSLTESLGLGIIESIDCGCKVIGADLPYMYAACEPSIVFDPLSENAIMNAFVKSMKNDIKPSTSKVNNEIDKLLFLLQ